ncbi:MAG: AraC family transcriptional regulator [Myxococcales bacterium]|nr:AraC family transcriptional regulator [Myxococcales bacterium]
MEYLARTPPPPLDAFIERIWYCALTPPPGLERVLPGGTVDLVVNLAEDEIRIGDPSNPASMRVLPGAVVGGTHTRSFLVDPRQRASVFGVHFKPGKSMPFLGISPAEIVDAYVSLGDLWGCDGRNLRERLLEARSPTEQFRQIEDSLLRRLRRARPVHPAAAAAVDVFRAAGNNVRVATVAAAVGLSRRGLVDVFTREVGLAPKLYARLQRFHRTKARIAALGGDPSWAALAVDCGYCDQSHMIREFVDFAGISPARYLCGRGDETRFDHWVHA